MTRHGNYDVFICHRGPDTKRNTVSILEGVLESKGIKCFVDYTIEGGAEFWPTITDAIRVSKVQIIVLSPNFARSTWSLNELVQILNKRGSSTTSTRILTVVPVFCDVEISTVRLQPKGSAYDLSKLERSTQEEKDLWSKALKDISDIEGIEYDRSRTAAWGKVQEIVARVERILPQSRDGYDVLICNAIYRKLDFAGVLRGALCSNRIKCFDHEISDEANVKNCMDGILKSKLHIIILCPEFAKSRRCLDALAEIMNIQGSERTVLPVLYDVDEYDLRIILQDLSILHESEEWERRERWRESLSQISHLKGFEFRSQQMFEWEEIEKIVKAAKKTLVRRNNLKEGGDMRASTETLVKATDLPCKEET